MAEALWHFLLEVSYRLIPFSFTPIVNFGRRRWRLGWWREADDWMKTIAICDGDNGLFYYRFNGPTCWLTDFEILGPCSEPISLQPK